MIATASSIGTYDAHAVFTPDVVIDGQLVSGDTKTSNGSIWHNDCGTNDWIQVELSKLFAISRVFVQARLITADAAHAARFSDVELRVGKVDVSSVTANDARIAVNEVCGTRSNEDPEIRVYAYECNDNPIGR